VTYRMGPHSTSDDPTRYRSRAEVEGWARKDTLDRLRKYLVRLGLVTEASDDALRVELTAEIAAAVDDAERLAPLERESLFTDVYAEMPWHLREQLESLKKIPAAPT